MVLTFWGWSHSTQRRKLGWKDTQESGSETNLDLGFTLYTLYLQPASTPEAGDGRNRQGIAS